MKHFSLASSFVGVTALSCMAMSAPASAAKLPFVRPDSKVQLLYSFLGKSDGIAPWAGVVADSHGNLYGTTIRGGASGGGTVFKLSALYGGFTESLIYQFASSSGVNPVGGVVVDASGNVFGTTRGGGGSKGGGTVFELVPTPSSYTFEILEDLVPLSSTGDTPLAGLAADANGNLFGTASRGGFCLGGTVFALSPAFNVIHDFGCDNNVKKPAAAVTVGSDGAIYGTTQLGGDGPCTGGCGIVYKLTPGPSGYTKKTIHTFEGGNDGATPLASVTIGSGGVLYGTTYAGGNANLGIVYELTPVKSKYTETILYSFQGGKDAAQPMGGVTMVGSDLYGTTKKGGTYNIGTIFKLSQFHGSFTESVAYSFDGVNGQAPQSTLLLLNGLLYGTATQGGTRGFGTVFRFNP